VIYLGCCCSALRFAAAHKVLLQSIHPSPYYIPLYDPTHPPYATRHKLLVRAMHFMEWDKPRARKRSRICSAEIEALHYIMHDPFGSWARFFSDRQLERAIKGIQKVLQQYGGHVYEPPDADALEGLVQQLMRRVPPVRAKIAKDGSTELKKTPMSNTLYAGWVYWLGYTHLRLDKREGALSFFNVNRLCDQALLQECAIGIVTP